MSPKEIRDMSEAIEIITKLIAGGQDGPVRRTLCVCMAEMVAKLADGLGAESFIGEE